MEASEAQRQWKRVLIVTLIATATMAIAHLIRAWRGHFNFYDDTYYYIVPAINFVRTGIFTFDGTNPTNGFHPLWEVLLVGTFRIVGIASSLHSQLFTVECLEVIVHILTAACCALAARLAMQRGNREAAMAFVGALLILIGPTSGGLFDTGMETVLAAFFLVLCLHWFIARRYALFGIAAAGLVLSRLDLLVFFVIPLWLYICVLERPRLASLIGMVLPVAIGMSIYSAINFHYFGDIRPISGALKSTFPHPRPLFSIFLDPWFFAHHGQTLASLLIPNIVWITLFSVAAAALALSARDTDGSRLRWMVLSAVSILPVLNWCLFQRWNRGVEVWYLGVPAMLSTFVLFGAFAAHLGSNAAARLNQGLMVLFGITAAYYLVIGLRTKPTEVSSPVISWMRQQSPKTVFATTDSGEVGFFSERSVINLDGLINNFAYQRALIRPGGLAAYLRSNHVDYLLVGIDASSREGVQAHPRPEPMWQAIHRPDIAGGQPFTDFDFYVYSYLYMQFSDSIHFTPEQLAFRSGDYCALRLEPAR